MAKTKQKKQQIISELEEKLKKVKSVIFANFDQLSVKDVETLRANCEKEKVDFTVTKKSLLKIALGKSNIKEIDPKSFASGVATAFSYEDEVAPAKIIHAFAKDHETLKMYGGIFEGKFVDESYLKQLAVLPSKNELYAKIVGSIKAPVSNFVYAMKGNLNNLVYALSAVKDKKQESNN
ncbi:50S ribosomal protein L10 [Candidatus Parcubacteria bacterium]|nr:MAG: 50S ribosomal protein L10 [Candidatus Parcubacteria bacterium]